MRIPKPNEVVNFEHKGQIQHAVVEDVRPERVSMWRLWVVPIKDLFSDGDEIVWITHQGKRVSTFVRDLQTVGNVSRFAILAGEDW